MASVITTPLRKSILKQHNSIITNSEKENHRGVILIGRKPNSSSDDLLSPNSEDWTPSTKRRSGLPNYVTNAGGGVLRRRQMRSPTSSQSSTSSHVIARRNERERNRVRQVNDSFAALRRRIPDYLCELEGEAKQARRKLSKVETLRLAVDYIQQLETLLQPEKSHLDDDSDDDDIFSSNDTTTLGGRSEFESEHEADIINSSRDGMCQEDSSSDEQSPVEEEPFFSDILGKNSFLLRDNEGLNLVKVEKIDMNVGDDQDFKDDSLPLPTIAQSFPSANLGYNVMFMQ